MKLHEVIESIESLPEDATIFAERINGEFLSESEAALYELTDEEMTRPIKEVAAIRAPGKDYFLEVFVAKEVIEGWQDYRGGNDVTVSKLTEVVIFYAENDAWPMTDEG
jgi:hypothetical protein